MSNVASTLLPFLATMSNEMSYFRQSRNKLNMLNLFRLCRKDEISFDIVAETGNIVAKKRHHCRSNSSINQSINQHSILSKGRNFTIESFDIVAVCGNNVDCCFHKVERSFDNVACCFDIVAGVDGALQVSAVADRHARRGSSRLPCCTQMQTVSVINLSLIHI